MGFHLNGTSVPEHWILIVCIKSFYLPAFKFNKCWKKERQELRAWLCWRFPSVLSLSASSGRVVGYSLSLDMLSVHTLYSKYKSWTEMHWKVIVLWFGKNLVFDEYIIINLETLFLHVVLPISVTTSLFKWVLCLTWTHCDHFTQSNISTSIQSLSSWNIYLKIVFGRPVY